MVANNPRLPHPRNPHRPTLPELPAAAVQIAGEIGKLDRQIEELRRQRNDLANQLVDAVLAG